MSDRHAILSVPPRATARLARAAAGFWCALALLLVAARPAGAWNEVPLVANIGHNLTGNSPWSAASSRTVNKRQAVYMHALDSNGNPLQNDIDWDQGCQDDADFDWDYCFPTDYDTFDTLTAVIGWRTPGDRTVRLRVTDDHEPVCSNDQNVCDELLIRVTMTVETDCMEPHEEEYYDLVGMDLFPGRWAGAGYGSVTIDADHDSSCTYYQYLYDAFATDAELTAYLSGYENENCDLYLIGIDKWHQGDAVLGYTWPPTAPHKWSCICRGRGAGLAVELHEPACHDADVGAIGHCTTQNPCACRDPVAGDEFCASCKQELKDYIKLQGP
jgi:hypothetical protein